MDDPKRASLQTKSVIVNIVNTLPNLSKPHRRFIISTLILYLSLRGRYTFKGLSRYGSYSEKMYRLWFDKTFDFLEFNICLCDQYLSKDLILVFDPSFLPKSGKHTPNIGKFYSGCLGKAIKGLELGGLGVVDLEQHTAFSLEAIPTPAPSVLKSEGKSIVDHYANAIIDRANRIQHLSTYLVVDGYFAKQSFVTPIMEQSSLHVISKFRKDANLKYLYTGPQKQGPGRPKLYAGKVDLKNIDPDVFECTHQEEDHQLWEAVCYSVSLKRKVKVVYLRMLKNGKKTEKYALFFATDLKMNAREIILKYKARFQIEFLFRDAKQHTGLTHCQARCENKLYLHLNMSLTAVGVAKVAHHCSEKQNKKTFSMANIKTIHLNELTLEMFLDNFQINPENEEINSKIRKLLNIGTIAA